MCISEFVRQTLTANTSACADRTVTIPLGLLHEPVAADESVLERLGVKPGEFLLYPANFWPHKNHLRLFEALRLVGGESRPKLVCTGAPNKLMRTLRAEAPAELVIFAGYVSEAELAALYEACAALIFPSLYEGYGMPVAEAMARGKPVLCSNVTSLPEVAGGAAIFFDPLEPSDIARAIASLADAAKVADVVECGRLRAARLPTASDLARRYLSLFEQTLSKHHVA